MPPSKMRSLLNTCVILIVSLLIFSASQVCSETRPDEIIAVLNGAPIYRSEIEQSVAQAAWRPPSSSPQF